MLDALAPGVAVLGTTATANDRVVGDVARAARAAGRASRCAPTAGRWPGPACGSRCSSCRGRPSGWRGSSSTCRRSPGSGIVYTLTKRDAEQVAAFLTANGIPALAYSGEQDTERPDRHRGAPAAQRDQGGRRDQRAGHGLRQGRPDVRRALPGARLGRLLLPAGRPRRARRRARRRRPAARRRGPADPGLLHRAGVPVARARGRGARRAARPPASRAARRAS